MNNYPEIWQRVIQECAPDGHEHYFHGPEHWRRVERNALILASGGGVSVDVVRLFAIFHDSKRENDGHDPQHGARGAAYARLLRGDAFILPDEEFELLEFACIWHTTAKNHDNQTIGACWDADRLDLGRVGITPDPRFMSTAFGAEIAAGGDIGQWEHLADPWLQTDESGGL